MKMRKNDVCHRWVHLKKESNSFLELNNP